MRSIARGAGVLAIFTSPSTLNCPYLPRVAAMAAASRGCEGVQERSDVRGGLPPFTPEGRTKNLRKNKKRRPFGVAFSIHVVVIG